MRCARPAEAGFSPLDKSLALVGGRLSPRLMESVVRLGTWMPFERVPEALDFFTGVRVDPDTARRLTEAAGAALVAEETAVVERLEAEQPEPPAGPAVQQLSADGAMVPLVGGEWAEVKTVAIGTVETTRTAGGEVLVHARELSYFSRLADHETFARQAWGELHRRGIPRAGVVVGVMDGSDWLQGFLDLHRPDAVRILDFPHAVEHLASAAQATFGTGTLATANWLEVQRHTLRHGDPAAVLGALAALPAATAPDPMAAARARDATLAYLQKRGSQIQYAAFRARGYPIGSGMVESANKLVVEARLKGSGMRWARSTVNPMVALRAAACSDRWQALWPVIWLRLRQQAADRRRQRWAAQGIPPPPLVPVSPPSPRPASVPAAVAIAPAQPTRLVVNGKPTSQHPWKRFSLLHNHRACHAKL